MNTFWIITKKRLCNHYKPCQTFQQASCHVPIGHSRIWAGNQQRVRYRGRPDDYLRPLICSLAYLITSDRRVWVYSVINWLKKKNREEHIYSRSDLMKWKRKRKLRFIISRLYNSRLLIWLYLVMFLKMIRIKILTCHDILLFDKYFFDRI